jgi:hypothetical protein
MPLELLAIVEGKTPHSTPSIQLYFQSNPSWIDIRSTAALPDTDQLPIQCLSWLLEYHPISRGVGVEIPVVPCTTEQFPTVVIFSGSLSCLVPSFPVGCSGPRTLVVSSGGSQSLHCRSPYCLGRSLRGDSSALPRTRFANSTVFFLSIRFPLLHSSSSHDQQPCSPTWSLVHSPRLPRSIEVLRFVVDFH